MDTIQTSSGNFSYSDRPPVLIGASSARARTRAQDVVTASGWRVAATVDIADARERLGEQISTAAVWLELDQDCGGPMDELLSVVSSDVAAGRYAAVVSGTSALLDPIVARLDSSAVEVIVDADEAQRALALAFATSRAAQQGGRLSDVASDQNAARLRQLSDEVSRIAASLARLSAAPPVLTRAPQSASAEQPPEVSAETVRAVIRARRLRARYFPDHLFADPAWDMLLDLFQAEIAQLRVPVSSLCIAAAVPATTALRWLKTMVQEGVFVRRADPHDGRRVFVELAPPASDALKRYFGEVGQVVVI